MKNLSILILLISFSSCLNKKGRDEAKELRRNDIKIDAIKNIDNQKYINDCEFLNNHNILGIGLMIWDFDCEDETVFYNDAFLKDIRGKYNFCGKVDGICPLFYKPDYGIMHFVVTEINDLSYRLIINKSEYVYIKKTTNFEFKNWKDFFEKEEISVSNKDGNNILYDILSYDGDFLNVINSSNKETKKIKWRDGNRLLLNFHLLK